MDQVEARLAATGEVRLPGVGLLRRTSGGVILGVEADLLAVVNRTYEGLAPVGAVPALSAPPPEVEVTRVSGSTAEAFGAKATSAEETEHAAAATSPDAEADGSAAGETREEQTAPSGQPGPQDAPSHPEPEPAEAAWADASQAEPATSPTPEGPPSDAPLRDLSSEPGARPYTPPDFSGPDASIAFTPPDAVAREPEPTPDPGGDEPPAPGSAPKPAPETERISPTDATFVDEATLDADLDELVVPFGAGAALSDVLPTTPAERDPTIRDQRADPPADLDALDPSELDEDPSEPSEYTSEPDESPGEAAPMEPVAEAPGPEASADPIRDDPSAESPSQTLQSDDSEPAPVETASYTIDEPAARPAGPATELSALLVDPPDERAAPADPRASDPFADLDLGEDPPAVVPPPQETAVVVEEDAPTSEATPKRDFPWWLVALAVALALALLLAYLWPRLATRTADAGVPAERSAPGAVQIEPARADVTAEDAAVEGAAAAPAPARPVVAALDRASPAAAAPQPPTVRSGATPSRRTAAAASGGGTTRDDDPMPPRPGLGQAPAPGYAISPPRVAGLPAADVRALSGRAPVDSGADAWTLVVLSTASRDDAGALSARYRSAGYRTGVLASDRDARPTFRVAVGQFADRDQARRLSDRLPPQAPADSWPLDLRTL